MTAAAIASKLMVEDLVPVIGARQTVSNGARTFDAEVIAVGPAFTLQPQSVPYYDVIGHDGHARPGETVRRVTYREIGK